jgi:hypothetical protein
MRQSPSRKNLTDRSESARPAELLNITRYELRTRLEAALAIITEQAK